MALLSLVPVELQVRLEEARYRPLVLPIGERLLDACQHCLLQLEDCQHLVVHLCLHVHVFLGLPLLERLLETELIIHLAELLGDSEHFCKDLLLVLHF